MANIKQIIEGGVNKSMVTASLHSNQTVGLCIEDEKGLKYVLVYAELQSMSSQHGCTIASGSTTGYSVTVSALSGSSPLCGVPVETIPTGQYGFVQTSGYKRVKADSIIVSANTPCLLSSAGVFSQQSFQTGLTGGTAVVTEPFISSNNICGYILSTTTAAFGKMDVFFKSQIYPA